MSLFLISRVRVSQETIERGNDRETTLPPDFGIRVEDVEGSSEVEEVEALMISTKPFGSTLAVDDDAPLLRRENISQFKERERERERRTLLLVC